MPVIKVHNALIYNDNSLFCMLNESLQYHKLLSFQTYSMLHQSKPFPCILQAGCVCGSNLYRQELKMALMNALKCQDLSQHPRADK